jgi:hypothetical protein
MSIFARTSFAWCMLTLLAICIATGVSAQTKKVNPEKKLPDAKLDLEQSKFMRMKLEACRQILEGLTTENAALVKDGANKLVEMSAAEKWQVHNDVMYRQFSNEFQRSARSLLEAAEKENFDGAALKWLDTTMKCIECHKFVRGARLAAHGL